jgi:hypothetical protein
LVTPSVINIQNELLENSMKIKNYLLLSHIILASTLLQSCGQKDTTPENIIEKDNSKSEAPSISEDTVIKNGVNFTLKRSVELEDDFSNIEEVKSKLNTFRILAKFNNPIETASFIRCSKVLGGGTQYPLLNITEGSLSKELEISLDESELNIEVNCQVTTNKKELSSASFRLNKSLLIKNQANFKSFIIGKDESGYILDRLIIERGAGLYFGSDDVRLQVKDLYSDNGIVGTFKKDELHPHPIENQIGRSGGNVSIYAEKSFGSINVNFIGGQGSDQAQIPDAKNIVGLLNDSSRDSVTDYRIETCPFLRFKPVTKARESDPCRNWKDKRIPFCAKSAVSGAMGINGENGFKGNPGGNSGRLTLITQKVHTGFTALFQIEAGAGGKGGNAGLGSEGTNGGKGSEACAPGEKGANGRSGSMGTNGDSGLIEISCVENLSLKTQTCTKN